MLEWGFLRPPQDLKTKMLRPLLLGLCLLAPAASAGEIIVPTDQPNLAAALAVAGPADVIVVRTALPQNVPGGQLVVDVPLVIVGDPVCRIDLEGVAPSGGMQLAGPGYGELTLINVDMGYAEYSANGVASLWGTGFDAVRLYSCDIRHDNLQPTGLVTEVFPAVDLTGVAELSATDCYLLGGSADSFDCAFVSFYRDGEPAIQAPGAAVTVIDSHVQGGWGSQGEVTAYEACPPSLDSWPGSGGAGIVAAEAYTWASTVLGGAGATWATDLSFSCSGASAPCGTKPDGPAFVVGGTVSMNPCSRLTQATTEAPIGGVWSLTWDALAAPCLPLGTGCPGGCTVFLFLDPAAPSKPFPFQTDHVYLNPGTAFLVSAFPSLTTRQIDLPIPAQPVLVGLPLTAQALLTSGELSGPVSGLITP